MKFKVIKRMEYSEVYYIDNAESAQKAEELAESVEMVIEDEMLIETIVEEITESE